MPEAKSARRCYYQGAEHEDSVWENGLYQFFKRIFKTVAEKNKMMKIFETHAHYDDEAFREDREALFDEMFANDIDTIINVGASFAGCEQSVALADSHEKIYAAVGIHPEDVEELTEARMAWLKKTASENEKVLAIGEIGLDYHYPEPAKEIQQQWFRRQLRLAADIKKPVIIHSREACQDTLACMRAEHAEQIGGVIHCYSYSKEAAQEFLKIGLLLRIWRCCDV